MIFKRFYYFLINSNIYISLAAVFLTVQAQIQLGMHPQWHPYLFIIFFATMLEYNFHRLITLWFRKEILADEKYTWLRNNIPAFYTIMIFSVLGFFAALVFAKTQVIIILLPIGLITIFYSLPIFKIKKKLFRLREISILKIFLISSIWALSTVLLPVIQSDKSFDKINILLMLTERMLFVFAITIPFDIRDIESDRNAKLKTIPLLMGEKKALQMAIFSLILFAVLCIAHYIKTPLLYTLPALIISAVTTFIFMVNNKLKKTTYYYYGILDGTMFFQGLMVIISYYIFVIKTTC
ncbi:MAG TPA: UbiA family prenyltransferase [Bacteroidia bacterium]|nr:UbiA family prenyltransferase [Bacteroidia bacterium]